MKKTVLFLNLLFWFGSIFCQTKIINGNYYYKEDSKWFVGNPQNEDTFEVDLSILTIKFEKQEEENAFLKQYDSLFYKVSKNKLGYVDCYMKDSCWFENFMDIFAKYEKNIIINSYGKFLSFITPNDEECYHQWYLQEHSSRDGIEIQKAWDITTGNPNIIVAIIDYGIDWAHPDLDYGADTYSNLFFNDGEDAWSNPHNPATGNGLDDDNNGFIDDWRGWGFCVPTQSNNTCPEYSTLEDVSHGTAIAGIIGGKTNNGIGIAGIAGGNSSQGVSLLSAALMVSYSNVFNTATLDEAIIYSVDMGAKIIQLSLCCYQNDGIDSAIQYATNHNVLIVCSSGNIYKPGETAVKYPARNEHVMAVSAMDSLNKRFHKSCYGSELSVAAPGVSIYSTFNNNGYHLYGSGTSYASPMVSGIAALMLSINPSLTRDEIKNIIEATCTKTNRNFYGGSTGPGLYVYSIDSIHPNGAWNDEMGYGLINAHKAVFEAYIRSLDIIGNTSLNFCTTYSYTLNHPELPDSATIVWSTSSNLSIVSGQNTPSIQVTALNSGAGWIKATIHHLGEEAEIIKSNTITNNLFVPIMQDFTTTSSMSINSNRVISGTFTISSGHTVSVTSNLMCLPNAKILIQPNGKLILNGSTITNACPNKLWQGIILSSQIENRQRVHATVELKNGAIIENASNAISTSGFGNYEKGGRVFATESVFKNNRRSVEFLLNSSGDFKKCDFIIDNNNLFANNNTQFNTHVTAYRTKSLSFYGCDFLNNATTGARGKGISTIDAIFKVSEYCTQYSYSVLGCKECNTTPIPSVFSGFLKAIESSNSQTSSTFSVELSNFSNNTYSIYTSALNNYKITQCYFNLTPNIADTYCGIYSNNCSGFQIEENSFNGGGASNYSKGIFIKKSGSSENLIYRNNITNFYHGIYASDSNGYVFNPPSGLQFKCNYFSGNTYDIYIPQNSGVRALQGSVYIGAGNVFSPNAIYHIYNHINNYPVIYYYNNLTNQNPTNVYNVTKYLAQNANTCTSTLCDGGVQRNDNVSLKLEEYKRLDLLYQEQLALFKDYHILLDSLLINPNYSIPQDILNLALAIQDSLSSISCKMAVISNVEIRKNLIEPEKNINIIDQLEIVRKWQYCINTPVAKYDLVETNYQLGDYETAQFVLHQIPTWFEMDENETAEYQNFTEFYNFRNSIRLSGRDWSQMTESEIAQLQILAENNTGRSSSMAKGVLCFFYDICYEQEEIRDREISNPVFAKAPTTQTSITVSNLKVYPNPTRDVIHFEWIQPESGFISIKIFNVMGQLINSVSKSDAAGGKQYFELQMNEHPNGIYYYLIETGSKTMNGKIVKM